MQEVARASFAPAAAPSRRRARVSSWLPHTDEGKTGMSHVDPLPSLAVPPRPRSKDSRIQRLLDAAAEGANEFANVLQEVLQSLPPNTKISDQFGTALHWAVSRGNVEVVDMALDHLGRGIINFQSRLGHSALHVACHLGQLNVVAALLHAGANATLQSRSGMTPLHHAVVSSNVHVAAALLAHGAPVSQPFDASRPKATHAAAIAARVSATATGVAKQRAAREMLALLEKEEKLHTGWTRASRALACEEMRRLLVQDGARVDARLPPDGRTALMLASRAARPDTLALLLSHGASVHAVDSKGRTALHHAAEAVGARHGLDRIVSTLLSAGARADAVDGQGRAPHEVAESARPQQPEVSAALYSAFCQRRRMRRWRMIGRLIGLLHSWHARAAARAYAPGGIGAHAAALDWEQRITRAGSKRPRE